MFSVLIGVNSFASTPFGQWVVAKASRLTGADEKASIVQIFITVLNGSWYLLYRHLQ